MALPTWTDRFRCYACGSKSLTIDHAKFGNCGGQRSIVHCRDCQERYHIGWNEHQPDKYLVIDRKKWTKNGKRGGCYRSTSHPKTTDAFRGGYAISCLKDRTV